MTERVASPEHSPQPRTRTQALPSQAHAAGARQVFAAAPRASFPHGVLAGDALLPSAKKLPFLILGLAGLAIVLLALGALPATAAPHPLAATLLAQHRLALAAGGLAMLAAAMVAYLLI